MPRDRRSSPPPPLTAETLRALGLNYVGRFATTRGKLRDYLRRKLRERGWAGESAPDVDALAERFAELGYIDDRAFATARAEGLTRRGFGARRVVQALNAAGVTRDDVDPLRDELDEQAVDSALAFARRRRFGPFAVTPPDPDALRRQLAAFARAGHGFEIARQILKAPPGDDAEALRTSLVSG